MNKCNAFAVENDPKSVILTGYPSLDEQLGGLKGGELLVIASRPSVGKTSLAMNIAERCVLGRADACSHSVAVFSLELPIDSIAERLLASRANINFWAVNRNGVGKEEQLRLAGAAAKFKDAPLYIDADGLGIDVSDLRERARKLKNERGVELVIIDYLQLCRCLAEANKGRKAEMAMIAHEIKAMARELDVPVIVLSQLSRPNGKIGERPHLSDLRDSSAIAEAADAVCLLWRPLRNAELTVAHDDVSAFIDIVKNRNGKICEVPLKFIREYMRFSDNGTD